MIPPFRVVMVPGAATFKLETFVYKLPPFGDTRWNVSYARQLVEAGHTLAEDRGFPVPISRHEMAAIAQRNAWDGTRLDRANPAIPGIAAPIIYQGATVYILIDGHHRNARCLRDGLTFHAWRLSLEAAEAVHMEGPEELKPWTRRTESSR